LLQSILKRYPSLSELDVGLRDDGKGVFVSRWNSTDPIPTVEQIQQWAEEDKLIQSEPSEFEQIKKQQTDLVFALMTKGVL
jgi:hypothetical protein